MCPKIKGAICTMVDIDPRHLNCFKEGQCTGDEWALCDVYFSQFFFDADDRYVLDPN